MINYIDSPHGVIDVMRVPNCDDVAGLYHNDGETRSTIKAIDGITEVKFTIGSIHKGSRVEMRIGCDKKGHENIITLIIRDGELQEVLPHIPTDEDIFELTLKYGDIKMPSMKMKYHLECALEKIIKDKGVFTC